MPITRDYVTSKLTADIDDKSVEYIFQFLSSYIPNNNGDVSVSHEESKCIEHIIGYVANRFKRMNYILGLALDFILLSEALVQERGVQNVYDPALQEEDIFKEYELITERKSKGANTLTLKIGNKAYGIRKFEEGVLALFCKLDLKFPSAYVYNTGQWHKYKDLLVACFRLSKAGRRDAIISLIDFGLLNLKKVLFFKRLESRSRALECIIDEYPRQYVGENGGLTFQALCYGYTLADRGHLTIVADKVRTGSARQKRIGDIDCYFGLDPELAVEVKDLNITEDNVDKELGSFFNNVTDCKTLGIIMCKSVDKKIEYTAYKKDIYFLTEREMLRNAQLWDWQKQLTAIRGMLHYLAHIEQDSAATMRFLTFLLEREVPFEVNGYIAACR